MTWSVKHSSNPALVPSSSDTTPKNNNGLMRTPANHNADKWFKKTASLLAIIALKSVKDHNMKWQVTTSL